MTEPWQPSTVLGQWLSQIPILYVHVRDALVREELPCKKDLRTIKILSLGPRKYLLCVPYALKVSFIAE